MLTGSHAEGELGTVRGNLRVPKFPSLEPWAHCRTALPTRMPSASEAADHWPGECGLAIGFSVPVESYTRTYQAAWVWATALGMATVTVLWGLLLYGAA